MAIQYEIHPSIGVARAGLSDEHFFGPAPGVKPPAKYRDSGKLRKQAARFQVFECDRDSNGKLTRDPVLVTPAVARVRWTVEVANRKGAAIQVGDVSRRRNGATGIDATDKELIVAPGPRTVDDVTPGAVFDGAFRGVAVRLGRARREADGSLVFTGGSGISRRVPKDASAPAPDLAFADNDDWYDDTCDGIVQAEVTAPGGVPTAALAARVICGPPDFAPGVMPWLTLHDLAYQAAVDSGFLPLERRPSFARFIRPFLVRTTALESVSAAAAVRHGTGQPADYAAMLAKLADPSAANAALRVSLLARLRHPGETGKAARRPGLMPRLYNGDENRGGPVTLALPQAMQAYFLAWAAGNFVSDPGADPFAGESVVDRIDRMAMEPCSGGGFFPGIEFSRLVKDKASWSAPYRLDPAIPPGKFNEGLAVPWQSDYFECEYSDDDSLAWWPSQRPDEVRKSDGTSAAWRRGIESHGAMVDRFSELGIVRANSAGRMVETERELAEPGNVT